MISGPRYMLGVGATAMLAVHIIKHFLNFVCAFYYIMVDLKVNLYGTMANCLFDILRHLFNHYRFLLWHTGYKGISKKGSKF